MYKKIMVFGMVLLIIFFAPLPSYALFQQPNIPTNSYIPDNLIDTSKELYQTFMSYPNSNYKIKYITTVGTVRYGITTQPLIFNKSQKKLTSPNPFYMLDISFNANTGKFDVFSGNINTLISESSYIQDVLYTNYDLKDSNGNLYLANTGSITGFDGRITLPANDGYKDNGTTFTFWQWYQLPTGVDSTDVKIDPYIDDSKDTYHSAAVTLHQKIPNTSKWNLNINLTVREYGLHTYKVVFKQISTGKVLGTLTRTFEALEGFIDENGDGLDDRTGQPPYDPLEPPDGSTTPEWDGTIVGFFKYLIDNVKYYNEMLISGVQTTINSIGKVPQMLGAVINLPPEIMALFTFGIIISILLRVLGR